MILFLLPVERWRPELQENAPAFFVDYKNPEQLPCMFEEICASSVELDGLWDITCPTKQICSNIPNVTLVIQQAGKNLECETGGWCISSATVLQEEWPCFTGIDGCNVVAMVGWWTVAGYKEGLWSEQSSLQFIAEKVQKCGSYMRSPWNPIPRCIWHHGSALACFAIRRKRISACVQRMRRCFGRDDRIHQSTNSCWSQKRCGILFWTLQAW